MLKKGFRYSLYLLLLLLALAVVAVLLLSIPSIQTRVLKKGILWLEEKTDSKIHADAVSIKWSGDINLQGVFMETPHGDSLLYLDDLQGKMRFSSLFSKQINIQSANITGAEVWLNRMDSTWNYQYLIDAFTSEKKDSTSSAWLTKLENANLDIQNSRLHYTTAKQSVSVDIDAVHSILEKANLKENHYFFGFTTGELQKIIYKTTDAKAPRKGVFSADFIQLNDSKIQAASLFISVDSIAANVQQLQTQEKISGLQIDQSKAQFSYTPHSITLSDADLDLGKSHFTGDFHLGLPSENAMWGKQAVQVDAKQLNLSKEDLYKLTGNNDLSKQKLTASGKINGRVNNLNINNLDAKIGENNQIQADGNIQNILDYRAIRFETFHLKKLNVILSDWTAFFPKKTLPKPLHNQDNIELKAELNGSLQNLEIAAIEGYYSRPDTGQITFGFTGNAKHVLDSNWHYTIHIDSLQGDGEFIQHLLPTTTLPKGKKLSDFIAVHGAFQVSPDSLFTDATLSTIRQGQLSTLQLKGLLHWSNTPDLNMQLSMPNAQFSEAELAHWIGTETRYIRPSFLQKNKVSLALNGSLAKLNADVKISSPRDGILDAKLKRRDDNIFIKWDAKELELGKILSDSLLTKMSIPFDYQLSGKGNFLLDENEEFSALAAFDSPIKFLENQFEDLILDAKGQFSPTFSLKNSSFSGFWKGNISGSSYKWAADIEGVLDSFVLDTAGALPHLSLKAKLQDIAFSNDSVTIFPDSLQLYLNHGLADIDSLNLSSDWLKIEAKGTLDPIELTTTVESILSKNFDLSVFSKTQNTQLQDSIFLEKKVNKNKPKTSFKIGLYRPELWTTGILPGLIEMDSLRLDGEVDFKKEKIEFYGILPNVHFQNTQLKNGKVKLRADKKAWQYAMTLSELHLSNGLRLGYTGLTGSTKDKIAKIKTFSTDDEGTDRFALNFKVTETVDSFLVQFGEQQTVAYSSWNCNKKHSITLPIYGNNIGFQNVRLERDDQTVTLNGRLNDGIDIIVANVQIQPFIKHYSSKISSYGGRLTTLGNVKNSEKGFEWKANGNLDSILVDKESVGKVRFETGSMSKSSDVFWDLDFHQKAGQLTTEGTLQKGISKGSVQLDSFDLQLIKPFLEDYVTDLSASASGAINFEGELQAVQSSGTLNIHNLAMKPIVSKVLYRAENQKLELDNKGILLKDFLIKDERNRRALVSGRVSNKGILDLDVEAKSFKLLNTNSLDSSFYYGKIIADLKGKLTGKAQEPNISLSVVPAEESEINYLYDDGATALDFGTDVVIFNNPEASENQGHIAEKEVSLPYEMDIKIDANEKLNIRAVIDKLTGDYFEGRGTGQLIYRNDPTGQMYVNGTVEIEEGSYRYTYNPLIIRNLALKKGSSIRFTGNPYEPELALTARYRVRTSIEPLVTSIGSEASYSREVFFVDIAITGTPEKPEIKFSIEYPNEDEKGNRINSQNQNVSAAIQGINQDPAQLTQQVSSLLILNSFLGQGTEYRVFSVGSQVRSFVTGQLNLLANEIRFVDIDFGENDGDQTEDGGYTVTIKKSLLEGRLVLSVEGAFGLSSRENDDGTAETSSTSGLRELAAEYMLTKDKQLRLRLFSKLQDVLFSNSDQQMTNGLGLFFKKEFGKYK